MLHERYLERRHQWTYQQRPVYWYDWISGKVVTPKGTVNTILDDISFDDLLSRIAQHARASGENIRAATLFIRSGRLVADRPKKAWYESVQSWKQERFVWDNLHGEYSHERFTIHTYGTHEFFGDERNIIQCYKAYHVLNEKLAHAFNLENYTIRATPASTGKDLLAISLPKGHKYYCLPEKTVDLLMKNFGQARIETLPVQAREIDGVYVIDGRWMYASCLSHLPVGEYKDSTSNEYFMNETSHGHMVPSHHGFYFVTATVPDNWQHIGLLKARDKPDGSGYYPNTPQETFTNWTSAAELAVALEYGWQVTIHRSILWEETTGDPLATWRRNLVNLRQNLDGTDPLEKLIQGSIRSIVLHTVGSFHSAYELRDRYITLEEIQSKSVSLDATRVIRKHPLTRKGMLITEALPLTHAREWIHPEWSGTVWGRARARLARFALRLPYEDIVSLRTDCVWCLSYPEWIAEEDTGKPGSFRLKEYIREFHHWPRDNREMRNYVLKHNNIANIEDDELPESALQRLASEAEV